MKPRYSAPAYNEFPPIKHTNFGPKKHFHSNLYVGNSENLAIEHNFDQSLEMRYSGVQLYLFVGSSENLSLKHNFGPSLEMRYSGV